MKNLKRVLALVLAFAMSLSVVAFAGAVYPDVEDAATYAEAVRILKALSIMQGDEQGNFNPDKTVTRAEMATILCNLTGVGEQPQVNTGFADTTKDHWASGYVAYAKNAGWINGYSADAFGPDDTVKWEQAVKLIMATAGWGIYAKENGDYPTGWVMAGAEAEITRAGAAGGIGEDCTRAKIAMLLYYALDANIMKQTTFGDVGERAWNIMGTSTIASKYLNVYKVVGKVTNSFKLDDKLEENYVAYEVDGDYSDMDKQSDWLEVGYEAREKINAYLTNVKAVEGAADLLGYTTIAYFHIDEEDEVSIVAIGEKGTRNKSTMITDMDLVYDETRDSNEAPAKKPAFSGDELRFSYWNDRDEDKFISYVKVANNAEVSYNNGRLYDYTNYTIETIKPAIGTIEMLDTDADGFVDFFKVFSYEIAIVDSVNTNKKVVSFKDKTDGVGIGKISFDTEDIKSLKDINITLDGEKISYEDLQENDILTMSSNDFVNEPRYYDIKVSRATKEGKVTGINDEDPTDVRVYIDDEEYKLVSSLLTVDLDINMGDEGTFYLDSTGKIAYVDTTSVASSNYGVVDKLAKDSMGTVSMRLLTLEGTKLTAPVADRIKLNGLKVDLKAVVTEDEVKKMELNDFLVKGTHYDDIVEGGLIPGSSPAAYYDKAAGEALPTTWFELISAIFDKDIVIVDTVGYNSNLNKLITYDTADGEVDEITFAVGSTSTKKFGYVGNSANAEWQAINNKFKGGKALSDTTVVINMAGTIDDWKVAKAENLVDENAYDPYYFAMQADGTVGAVVIFSSTSTINQDASLAYFVEARKGVYEFGNDDEDVYYITYYVDGALAETAVPVEESYYNTLKANLKPGSAFLYALNDKGYVAAPSGTTANLVVVFNAEDGVVPTGVLSTIDGDKKPIPGALDSFMDYGDGANLDNEVYEGVLVKAANGKLTVVSLGEIVTVQDDEGSFKKVTVGEGEGAVVTYVPLTKEELATTPADVRYDRFIPFDKFENIPVSADAKVLQYKGYVTTASKKLVACDSIVDLESSYYTRMNGQDINLYGASLTHVFVRMNNGTVTEVLGLDYDKN